MALYGEQSSDFMREVLRLSDAEVELASNDERVLRLLGRLAIEQADLSGRLANAQARLEKTGHDEVTGLLSRTAGGLGDVLERIDPTGTYLVGMLDLRGLKCVNGDHGHFAGDAVLAASAKALMRIVRSDSIVGRWGGDEFVVIVPLGKKDDIEPLMNRLEQCFGGEGVGECLMINETTAVYLSGRFGFQVIDSNSDITVMEALKMADDRLTEAAKEEGSRGSASSVAYAQVEPSD